MSKEDERKDMTAEQYIASLDDAELKKDTHDLVAMMQRISGEKPILYGYATLGFGVYKYEYTSGRKGEAHTLGFYPRKGKITIYLMDGTARYENLLSKLGTHTTTGYCIYIKRLAELDLSVLEQLLQKSYDHITTLSKQGPIAQILWQAKD